MNDTYGPTSGMPLAQYDREQRCWRTSEATSLWALPMSSLTLPTWGCLHDGVLYELPTPERHTIERGYSSLPTPVADNSRGLPNGGDYQSLPNTFLRLPTPTAQAAKHMAMDDRGNGTYDDHNLWSVAGRLLPTPLGQMGNLQRDDFTPNLRTVIEGNPMLRGKSLEQEALKMLPTPLAGSMGRNRTNASQVGVDEAILSLLSVGANTPRPLSAGQTSWADLLQPLPFDETTGTD